MDLDIISTLDMRSLSMEAETADPNVFEFDYTLWNLLSTPRSRILNWQRANFHST